MARSSKSDLRGQMLEYLLERVQEDAYPSATMLDAIEAIVRDDEVDEYTSVLFEKVRGAEYPSMDLIRRLYGFL
ncbi:MAG: hypothetical protein HOQ45_12090 [Nocardioidaceae bacterium]|nr:hypothetical protein [Nocardioidaceae bacterium]